MATEPHSCAPIPHLPVLRTAQSCEDVRGVAGAPLMSKGTRAYRWHKRYSVAELIALREKIEAENPRVEGVHYDGLWYHPKAVRAKFDDIALAITWHMSDTKE